MSSRIITDPYRYNKELFRPFNIFTGFIFLIFFISAGVLFAIHCRPVYYLCMKLFDIAENTGIEASVIKANYNALIDYCSPFFTGDLVFPTFSSSASGISHFEEVKVIFNIFHIAFVVSLIALIFICRHNIKSGRYNFLRTGFIVCLIVPLVLGLACAINFDSAFVIMHKVLFNNDDWLFDPATDPVITILPQNFFFVCALIIIFFVIAGSVTLLILYCHSRKNKDTGSFVPKKANYVYTAKESSGKHH